MQWRAHADRLIPYAIAVVLAGTAVYAYLLGSSINLNTILMLTGVAGGSVAAYFIYRSLDQEKTLELHGQEQVILESNTPSTHVVLASVGEQDFPFEPVRANIYLTNIGILCEPPGTGESEVYIPLDKITGFEPDQNGIRVRYVDINVQYAEVLLYVDDPGRWIQTLAATLNARAY